MQETQPETYELTEETSRYSFQEGIHLREINLGTEFVEIKIDLKNKHFQINASGGEDTVLETFTDNEGILKGRAISYSGEGENRIPILVKILSAEEVIANAFGLMFDPFSVAYPPLRNYRMKNKEPDTDLPFMSLIEPANGNFEVIVKRDGEVSSARVEGFFSDKPRGWFRLTETGSYNTISTKVDHVSVVDTAIFLMASQKDLQTRDSSQRMF